MQENTDVPDAEPEQRPMTMERPDVELCQKIESLLLGHESDDLILNHGAPLRELVLDIEAVVRAHPPAPSEPMTMERETLEIIANVPDISGNDVACWMQQQARAALRAHPPAVNQPHDEATCPWRPIGDNHHNAARCPYCSPAVTPTIDDFVLFCELERAWLDSYDDPIEFIRDSAHKFRASSSAVAPNKEGE